MAPPLAPLSINKLVRSPDGALAPVAARGLLISETYGGLTKERPVPSVRYFPKKTVGEIVRDSQKLSDTLNVWARE